MLLGVRSSISVRERCTLGTAGDICHGFKSCYQFLFWLCPLPTSEMAAGGAREGRDWQALQHGVSHAWQASYSLPSPTSPAFVFMKNDFFFLCFQIGFSATNSPDLVCECYCIGIPNICGHLNGGRKCELVPSCYLQLDILQRNRAAWPGMGSVMGGLG